MKQTDEVRAFIRLIERLRWEKGLTIEKLCDVAGIRDATYYHWTSGRASPTLTMALRVVRAMGMKVDITDREDEHGTV